MVSGIINMALIFLNGKAEIDGKSIVLKTAYDEKSQRVQQNLSEYCYGEDGI